jgi:hypothetical protein
MLLTMTDPIPVRLLVFAGERATIFLYLPSFSSLISSPLRSLPSPAQPHTLPLLFLPRFFLLVASISIFVSFFLSSRLFPTTYATTLLFALFSTHSPIHSLNSSPQCCAPRPFSLLPTDQGRAQGETAPGNVFLYEVDRDVYVISGVRGEYLVVVQWWWRFVTIVLLFFSFFFWSLLLRLCSVRVDGGPRVTFGKRAKRGEAILLCFRCSPCRCC